MKLHLVEVSPYLAKVQFETLCGTIGEKLPSRSASGTQPNPNVNYPIVNEETRFLHGITDDAHHVPVSWHRRLQTVPKGFNLYIAHEFFDALPIHKLQVRMRSWYAANATA